MVVKYIVPGEGPTELTCPRCFVPPAMFVRQTGEALRLAGSALGWRSSPRRLNDAKTQKFSNSFVRAGRPRRFRGAPAGSGAPGASFFGGLSLGRALSSSLDSVATGAQRLKIVEAVAAFGERQNVVDENGGSHQMSALGTVPAQRLACQDGVADALPSLVVAALVGGKTGVWQTLPLPRSAMGADTVAHNARARSVRARSIHYLTSEERACAGFATVWPLDRMAREQTRAAQLHFTFRLPPSPLYYDATMPRTRTRLASNGVVDSSTTSACVPGSLISSATSPSSVMSRAAPGLESMAYS